MYAAIIVLGALHGLVLLPILLSWFGDDRVLIGPFDDYASRQSFKDPATASSLGENTALQDEERFQRLD